MIPFLKQVAEFYLKDAEVEKFCFIFPNKRSIAFFRKYISELLRAEGGYGIDGKKRPMVSPLMLTMNELFYSVAKVGVTDRVTLLLELYKCYKEVNSKAETLDEFIFWGDTFLADFNDVDKYLVDPKNIFTNVADFKSIQDRYTYLTPIQRDAIEHFLKHFSKGKINIDAENPDTKEKFLRIWNILYPLYRSFNENLSRRNMAYEGMVYRDLAERLGEEAVSDVLNDCFPNTKKFVFVGLNALNECEKTVLRKMRKAGIASFSWDYSSKMIKDKRNKSSLFMDHNVSEFPQEFDLHYDDVNPKVNIISVPSSTGQAKQIPQILEQIDIDDSMKDCSIVLPDEKLLMSVLNSIPSEITDINVTMGYPLTGSAFYDLMSDISSMQLHLRNRGDDWFFYHKQVASVLSNGVLRMILSEKEEEKIAEIKRNAKYYIPVSDLEGYPLFDTLFRPVIKDPKASDSTQILSFAEYLISVILYIAPRLREKNAVSIELNFAKSYYNVLNKLSSEGIGHYLEIMPLTYIRLMKQLLSGVSVPFSGEPLKGLQIMGPLETRALDFKNVIILSCNEGIFPRKSVNSSFIPPELRKGFGLPTYEYQDAVWAYYFYRMLQRASQVWCLYDSRTEGIKSGEESRYIKQLQYHFKDVEVKRYIAMSELSENMNVDSIPKREEDVDKIRNTELSATALQNYLSCPAKFYYEKVLGLRSEAEVAESLDNGMLGNVLHNTMYALYLGSVAIDSDFDMSRGNVLGAIQSGTLIPLKEISVKYIEGLLGNKQNIKDKIRSLIKSELRSIEVTGRNLIIEDIIFQYVLKILERDKEMLIKRGKESFKILGLEVQKKWNFEGFRFTGFIDRLDSINEGELRVVDYKTGKVTDRDVCIDDFNAEEIVDALFGASSEKRPKIALQLFLYDMFIKDTYGNYNICNSIYSTAKLFSAEVENFDMNEKFCDLVKARLKVTLDEISDLSKPFFRTKDQNVCSYCDFKMICGR